MKVKAIALGFYGEKRRKPNERGSVFLLKNVADFSPNWMRVVEASGSEKSELKKILVARQKELSNPEPKRIKVVEDGFLHAAGGLDANNADEFDELFAEKATSEAELDAKIEKQQLAKKKHFEETGMDHPADYSGVEGADDGSLPAEEAPAKAPKKAAKKAAKEEAPAEAPKEDEAL